MFSLMLSCYWQLPFYCLCFRMDLSLPGLSLAHQLYIAVKAQGHGRLGTQALMLALEHLNGICSEKSNNVEVV